MKTKSTILLALGIVLISTMVMSDSFAARNTGGGGGMSWGEFQRHCGRIGGTAHKRIKGNWMCVVPDGQNVYCKKGGRDSSSGCADEQYQVARLRLNGERASGFVLVKEDPAGYLVNAQTFVRHVPDLTLSRMPFPPTRGLVFQYGKRISFAAAGFAEAFVDLAKVTMEPPLEIIRGTHWVPLEFLRMAVEGTALIRERRGRLILDVTLLPARTVGSVVPEAKTIADELESDFIVSEGEISLTSAIDLYTAGYVPDANGNNAENSYLVVQTPTSPRTRYYTQLPAALKMDQDEAMVWVGNTPPEVKYFSYQHYLVTRTYLDQAKKIVKLYARLGDSANNYNIPSGGDPYEQFTVFVISANQDTRQMVTDAIKDSGIDEDLIVYLDLPSETDDLPSETEPGIEVKFGLGVLADSFNFLHRATLFADAEAKDTYINRPPLELLRVTPRTEMAANPIPRPQPRSRITGEREQDDAELGELVETLQSRIIAAHSGDYQYVTVLETKPWLYPGGDVAIADREGVLGETNDTLYLRTKEFELEDDDLIVAFGPNHSVSGKSVYSNVSIYGAEAENGIGGIVSIPLDPDADDPVELAAFGDVSGTTYFGSASIYMPELPLEEQESLYAFKFARSEIDEFTYSIPYNDGDYRGLNAGDGVFLGFRNYVDLITTIGPYPGDVQSEEYYDLMGPPNSELYFDQVILFSNVAHDIQQ
ncbi:MAG: hypothetical protein GY792_33545 [Gammaproteobacteria bacterium]|nr:hypothetical protein [Gammaproteobacteria bacterium]